MILYTPENRSYPNENDISLSWQRGNIFGAGLELSIQPQRVAGLDSQYKSICHLDI